MDLELFTYYLCHVRDSGYNLILGFGVSLEYPVRSLHRCNSRDFGERGARRMGRQSIKRFAPRKSRELCSPVSL